MFFFSSRRRHTRCSRDWSSDVCSSDLFWYWSSRNVRSGVRRIASSQVQRKQSGVTGCAASSGVIATLAILYSRHTGQRSEEHTSELQSRLHLVCRLLLEKKKTRTPATSLSATPHFHHDPRHRSH